MPETLCATCHQREPAVTIQARVCQHCADRLQSHLTVAIPPGQEEAVIIKGLIMAHDHLMKLACDTFKGGFDNPAIAYREAALSVMNLAACRERGEH